MSAYECLSNDTYFNDSLYLLDCQYSIAASHRTATSLPYLILFDAQAVNNKAKTITRTICHLSVFYPTL